jgi:hypothetical protein
MSRFPPAVLLLAFAEGGVLLAYQLVCSKLMAPWFGTSLEVWAAILGLTLAGLAAGYAWGASLSTNAALPRRIALHMVLASIFLITLPGWQSLVQSTLSPMGLHVGAFLSALVLISPLMALLGTFSPLCISFLERATYPSHKVTGIIFGTSTLGGIVFSLLAGLLVIPTYGLTLTSLCLGAILLIATALFTWWQVYRPRSV